MWEAGGQDQPVAAAQPTGALITVPNWEVLRSNIVNYSRDFPYVWDEITVGIANESDLAYGVEVLQTAARRVLGDQMADAVAAYERLLRAERLAFVLDRLHDSVPCARVSRPRWSSALTLEVSPELAPPEHTGRIFGVYSRREVAVREGWSGASSGPRPGVDTTGRAA